MDAEVAQFSADRPGGQELLTVIHLHSDLQVNPSHVFQGLVFASIIHCNQDLKTCRIVLVVTDATSVEKELQCDRSSPNSSHLELL